MLTCRLCSSCQVWRHVLACTRSICNHQLRSATLPVRPLNICVSCKPGNPGPAGGPLKLHVCFDNLPLMIWVAVHMAEDGSQRHRPAIQESPTAASCSLALPLKSSLMWMLLDTTVKRKHTAEGTAQRSTHAACRPLIAMPGDAPQSLRSTMPGRTIGQIRCHKPIFLWGNSFHLSTSSLFDVRADLRACRCSKSDEQYNSSSFVTDVQAVL